LEEFLQLSTDYRITGWTLDFTYHPILYGTANGPFYSNGFYWASGIGVSNLAYNYLSQSINPCFIFGTHANYGFLLALAWGFWNGHAVLSGIISHYSTQQIKFSALKYPSRFDSFQHLSFGCFFFIFWN